MHEKPMEDEKREEEKKVAYKKTRWSDDQQNHEYYYDDAHGYEDFDPREDDELTKETDTDDPA